MSSSPPQQHGTMSRLHIGDFWSGDIGLTLVSISVVVLIFIIFPLREAGLVGRFVFDLIMLSLMVSGTLSIQQPKIVRVIVVTLVVFSAGILWVSWFSNSATIHKLGSFFSIVTSLLYCRIVLHVMLRGGPVTWSRIQGGVSAYLILGLGWASTYQLVEQMWPGSFQFVTKPEDISELTSRMVYYSFTTLTTVGGDIVAVSPIARSLTILESSIGQLFPAILIGALVAMAMQSRARA